MGCPYQGESAATNLNLALYSAKVGEANVSQELACKYIARNE